MSYSSRILIGLALLGYTVYEIRTGHASGKWRTYYRYNEPFPFWTIILFQLCISFAFLIGIH
jgi:hypothetical protein